MLRDALIVYFKEMREVLRDRRTLIFMIALPIVLVPVLIKASSAVMESAQRKESEKVLTYAVFGESELPELQPALDAAPGLESVELGSEAEIDPAIRDASIDFAVVVRAAENDSWPVVAELHYDNAPVFSGVKTRVAPLIESLSETRRDTRLAALGLSQPERATMLEPIVLKERGIAEMRELLGERLGGMLPYMFIIFCFLGALYPAIDLAAGEKERGTLETLLLAPISRTAIVIGKFAVVFTTAMVSTLLGTASLGFWLSSAARDAGSSDPFAGVIEQIGASELGVLALLLVPVAAILASMLLAISVYAKSFKEAQSYTAPLNLLVILPAVAALIPGVVLNSTTALIPITNIALAMKEVVKGTLEPAMLALILGSSTVLAVILLAACVRWFSRESVLFRQ